MLLSAVSILVVAQSSSEIPEEVMNNPVSICSRDRRMKCELRAVLQGLVQILGVEIVP